MKTLLVILVVPFLVVLHSTATLAQWQPAGVALCTAASDQWVPTIVSDGAGGAIVTWEDRRNGNDDIYAQRIDASGVVLWTVDGVALCTAADDQTAPTLVSDGAGGAIVTWRDDRAFRDGAIYAQRVDASGTVQWDPDGIILCASYNCSMQTIASDETGGAIVTWRDDRSGTYYDIYAQRVDASGVVLWTGNGVAVCTAADHQTYPHLVSDGTGGAIVTWSDSRGLVPAIYAQGIDASGVVQWTADGVDLCTFFSQQVAPTITSDGAGGAIVTWYDLRGGTGYRIYAQRISASGAVQWTTDGVALSTAANGSTIWAPMIVSDGTGGAIVTWEDFRSAAYTDIYAQRVDASGVVQWTADGEVLCTAAFDQGSPTIVSDGAGGAIVTWHDNRSGGFDHKVYAQRISPLGAVQWTADGVALCTVGNSQALPTIASDGFGGAIVAWQDYRSGTDHDIYAQRVNASGVVSPATGVDTTPSIAPLTVLQNHPNPFGAMTDLSIRLADDADVSIEVFDVRGRRVRTLAFAQQRAGWQSIPFDGRNDAGKPLPSGVYFYKITANGMIATSKLVIAR